MPGNFSDSRGIKRKRPVRERGMMTGGGGQRKRERKGKEMIISSRLRKF